MEVFTRALAKAESDGKIQGIKISKKALQVSHLLFEDVFLVFAKADIHNVTNLLQVIKSFSDISGQQINFQKSAVFFSKNMHPRHCRMLLRSLKMKKMELDEKYLGSPLLKRKKTTSFSSLVDNTKNRLTKWRGKFINQSGRSVLVKHVLNTLPSHHMGVFKIPDATIKELDKVQRNFWWGK
ncbi:uncharacterized protein LOC113352509 [Papaver somniferum]|uniref:uncharacterized protein LOC113352509 n=1 Tax=Papaver somniferum TaxID=3469 RepID=UPI000E6F8A08|nr:uncharacterized protein LOC113352509 [Papaver somniferum]